MRRLQRNNDELLEQVENLRTQVDHLQARYGIFLVASAVESGLTWHLGVASVCLLV